MSYNPPNANGAVPASSSAPVALATDQLDKIIVLLQALLTETKINNHLLSTGLNSTDNLEILRNDPYFNS